MWMHTSNTDLKGWMPNHFVPVVKLEYLSDTDSTEIKQSTRFHTDESFEKLNVDKPHIPAESVENVNIDKSDVLENFNVDDTDELVEKLNVDKPYATHDFNVEDLDEYIDKQYITQNFNFDKADAKSIFNTILINPCLFEQLEPPKRIQHNFICTIREDDISNLRADYNGAYKISCSTKNLFEVLRKNEVQCFLDYPFLDYLFLDYPVLDYPVLDYPVVFWGIFEK